MTVVVTVAQPPLFLLQPSSLLVEWFFFTKRFVPFLLLSPLVDCLFRFFVSIVDHSHCAATVLPLAALSNDATTAGAVTISWLLLLVQWQISIWMMCFAVIEDASVSNLGHLQFCDMVHLAKLIKNKKSHICSRLHQKIGDSTDYIKSGLIMTMTVHYAKVPTIISICNTHNNATSCWTDHNFAIVTPHLCVMSSALLS